MTLSNVGFLSLFILQVPSHVLLGVPHDVSDLPLTPIGEACLRMDLTVIHEILEKISYKDDEGSATEVCYQYHVSYFSNCYLIIGFLTVRHIRFFRFPRRLTCKSA